VQNNPLHNTQHTITQQTIHNTQQKQIINMCKIIHNILAHLSTHSPCKVLKKPVSNFLFFRDSVLVQKKKKKHNNQKSTPDIKKTNTLQLKNNNTYTHTQTTIHTITLTKKKKKQQQQQHTQTHAQTRNCALFPPH